MTYKTRKRRGRAERDHIYLFIVGIILHFRREYDYDMSPTGELVYPTAVGTPLPPPRRPFAGFPLLFFNVTKNKKSRTKERGGHTETTERRRGREATQCATTQARRKEEENARCPGRTAFASRRAEDQPNMARKITGEERCVWWWRRRAPLHPRH